MPKTIKTIINQATALHSSFTCVALLCVRLSGSLKASTKAIATLLLAIAITTAASAQVTYIYGDTTKIKARGTGNNELQIFNGTRSVEGFLYNTGNGLTKFKPAIDTAIALNDSTVRFSRGSAYFDITIHSTSSGGGTSTDGWSLTGNAGTTAGTNFIGTTDAQSLYFKVNNVVSGWLDAIGTNTSFGVDALTSIGSAGANTAIGHDVLHNNSTGIQNTGLGYQALMATTSGDYNTALGSYSLTGITTATHNTAVGVFSLSSLSTGAAYANNTGIGYNAGYGMISSDYGTYLGYKATGSNNLNSATAIGAYAKAEQSNSLILGSVNGINGASQTVRVGIGTTQPSTTLHLVGDLRIQTGSEATGKVLTSDADGVASWTDIDCPIKFDDIDGSPSNNAALNEAFSTKQDLITAANSYIDTQFYYYNGYKSYKLLAPDVRIAMDATYDPVSKFMTYGSKSNQILNLKNIGNIDTIDVFGGIYRYNVSTTGTKPGTSTGGTIYMYVQSDLNYHDGTNRVSQFAIDNNGQMWTRTYNAGWGSWISPAYSTDLANYLPLTGGTINGYVSMVHKSASPDTPSVGTSTYYVDNLGYFRFKTATGNYWRIDTTGMGTSNLTFKIANATVQGNTFNGASQLVQLNSSGYFEALDARNLTNISPTTGISVGAGTAFQQLRINSGGTAWELFTPTSGASTSGTSILKGDGSGGFANATAGTDYVSPSSTETLTNKSISGSTNTLTNIDLTTSVTNTLPYANGGTNVTTSTDLYGGYKSLFRRSLGFDYFNEFINTVATAATGEELISTVSGTGAGNSSVNATDRNRPGILRLSTGTTATGRAAISTNGSAIGFSGGKWIWEEDINLTQLSDGTNRFQLLAGFFDTYTTVNQIDGAYFLYDEGGVSTGSTASANWQLVTVNNSGRTFTPTSAVVATGSYTRLKIEVNAAGTGVAFYVNGVQVGGGTITTNIPTASARVTGFGELLIKSLGTTAVTCDIDYIWANCIFTTPR